MSKDLYIGQGAWHDGSFLAWSTTRKTWVVRGNATRFASVQEARKVANEARLGVENTNFYITRFL